MMRLVSSLSILVVLLLGTVASHAVAGQRDPIELDLKSAPAREVLAAFGSMAEAESVIAPDVEGQVTMTLTDVSWMTALDAVCEVVGCAWTLEGGHPRRLVVRASERRNLGSLGEPVDISLRDASPKQLFESVGEITGLPVELRGTFPSKVSLELRGVSAWTILAATCEQLGCRWALTPDEDGIVVTSAAPPQLTEDQARERLQATLDLSLKAAGARDVLLSFGRVVGVPVEISEDISGQVSVDLRNASAGAALTEVCRQVGCQWALGESASGGLMLTISSE